MYVLSPIISELTTSRSTPSTISDWSSRIAAERSVVERSTVARPWGRSREGDVLQVTAVKEKPRRHTRLPRALRDSSRDGRGAYPPRGLPHGLAAVPVLMSVLSLPISLDGASNGFSMPRGAGVRSEFGLLLRKLHTAASVRREAA